MKQTFDIIQTKMEQTERNLFLCKTVDQESIEELAKSVIKINEEDNQYEKLCAIHNFSYSRLPIKIYLDTYGGMLYQTFGFISIMEKSVTPIHTIVTGCAMSAGFMILISGHKRFAYENATPLYHQLSGGVVGTSKEMEDHIIQSKRNQKTIERIVIAKTKITKEKLAEIYKTKTDWYMTSKEAKKLNVIDEII